MEYRKENKFAFDEDRKENFIRRLKSVIGERSVRAAAKEWGLSFSTLNNYITRGTEPSFVAMQAIAFAEDISLDWLAFGANESNKNQPERSLMHDNNSNDKSGSVDKEHLRTAWATAFEFMGKAEAEALLKIIINGGARSIIKLAEHDATLEEAFMLLPLELKERAIDLIDAYAEAKKGAPEEGDLSNTASPASDKRQAS
ncbi:MULTISPECIES: helix-turn-helix domain-containing protein [unclassified Pantoea]|uniref:helix-turn-helix domain-containing protein n=1 Tax=unclassified Pantoea TaxID=2630326 RepID=UPI001232689D|nr:MULTISPECIES: helix-turn-helix domain-containing protein [unclassified Pantoea]KAA5957784.1 bacteriophage CI repressor [Pantoea sp. VH_16]KAA6104658.1 bacteriophage CI repressor [Pantoea sp. Bo_14]KAA6108034.1 bacteriophage CI repressor [Pantoea sp. Bo_11]